MLSYRTLTTALKTVYLWISGRTFEERLSIFGEPCYSLRCLR